MRTLLAGAVLGAAFAPPAEAQLGDPYCFGVSCPCGNDDPNAGCGNLGWDGIPSTGASLLATGSSTYVCADALTLIVTGMGASQNGLVYMGGSAIQLPFGDGFRCVGAGTEAIYRFPIRMSNFFGEFAESGVISTSQGFPGGAIQPGSTWFFQGWYRDPGGPCGNQFNLTNAVALSFLPEGADDEGHTELAGRPLGSYPFFHHVTSFNQGSPIHFALDPSRHPGLIGQAADIFVVASKTRSEWDGDATLLDVRGAPQAFTLTAGTIAANTVMLDPGFLNGIDGTHVGVGYDVVLDVDQDGMLSSGDLIDGYHESAGFYVVRNTEGAGPYAVTEILYSGGTFLGQDTYYPTNIGSLGQLPLVVVSHGNGHSYQWYDHIGFHMASYGYVVMSHQNNTQPGPNAASLTTLQNTDYLLGNLGTIQGGVLQGHIDTSRIIWIGHSRGGEGVARAYDQLVDGTYIPSNYSIDDIRLVSSIAPTDFLGASSAYPHDVDYHLWTGSADADVDGGADCDICQTYHLYERAEGRRASITLQGAGHGAFHAGTGSLVASGPCLLTRAETHQIMRGYFLPLARWFVDGDHASKDFVWRQWEEFRPVGAPLSACVVVNHEMKEPGNGFVIDDFQTGGLGTSSSGTPVIATVTDVFEGLLDDLNNSFDWTPADPMNGMTRMRSGETTRGIVFSWNANSFLEFGVLECERDFSDNVYLSFRAAQGTRHPNTVAVLGDLVFDVTLRDGSGGTSRISIGAYGGGIEEPYQRTGLGTGPPGWHNEFETIRIRLDDFLTNGSGLDLTDVEAVRFEFGPSHGAAVGRLGMDDIEITIE